nr:hypothetical protein Clen_87 [Cedratvirus lena]
MSCGIILVLSDDPLSRITVAITKQEFSSIGYYYKYGSMTKIILNDPFGLPLYNCDNLSSLLSCPFVRRVALRPVRPELENAFRMALTKSAPLGMNNAKDMLYFLFGFPMSNDRSSLSSIDSILNRMGKNVAPFPINTLYGSGYEDCISPPCKEKGVLAHIQIFSYLASSLNQQSSPQVTTDGKKVPSQIQSYILDEEVFSPLHEVKSFSVCSNLDELKKVYQKQLPLLSQLLSSFASLLHEPGFLFLVAKGSRNQNISLLQESLQEALQLCTQCLSSLPSSPLHGELEFQKQKAQPLLSRENKEASHLVLEKKEEGRGNLSSFKSILLSALQGGEKLDLRDFVEVYNSLTEDQIDLNSILGKRSYKKVKGEYFLSPGKIGVVLRSGDRLSISLSRSDFSCFDYETLVEILDALDNLGPDLMYDEIRTRVAEELASYSSYSSRS